MKIIADENIPLVDHYFGPYGEVILLPGREISREHLLDADILLVRSVTKVNEALLKGTSVQFVGSPVSGIDHIDTQWLNAQGIRWAQASGSNADAVVEYVASVVAALQLKGRVGVIGCGTIGAKVVERLKQLSFDVIQCDPFRMEQEVDFVSVPISEFKDLDLITLHVPLTYTKAYPTFHMIEKNFLQKQKPGCVLLNAARGEVIDSAALKQYGAHLRWCLDVWENEPNIDQEILEQAVIATPHIAGYSIQAKFRGIEMIYSQACDSHIIPRSDILFPLYPRKKLIFETEHPSWSELALNIFDPLKYTDYMKNALQSNEKTFDQLRKEFTNRYERAYVDVE